jgi:hypothetical protein
MLLRAENFLQNFSRKNIKDDTIYVTWTYMKYIKMNIKGMECGFIG